uniref:R3H domain and coiled-coil containing 1 L homeolog n=1 Tax=Xenopus laevis TaxID=8355 RepID=UPI0039819F48
MEQPSLDGVYLGGIEYDFYQLISTELENFMHQGDLKKVLLFPPVSSRLRYIIHRLTESHTALSSFSVGEGWQRRTVICYTSIRLPTQEEETRPKKCERSYVANKMGKGRAGWRPKNRRPDQALYAPRGRFGGRENMAGDMNRKSLKAEEKREDTEKPVGVLLTCEESEGEKYKLGEGSVETEKKMILEDEAEMKSTLQTTEEKSTESMEQVKDLRPEDEEQKEKTYTENEEDLQTLRSERGEENQPISGNVSATKKSELCEPRSTELQIIAPTEEGQKMGALIPLSDLVSPESASEERFREPGKVLLCEGPEDRMEGSLAECKDVPGPSEANDNDNRGAGSVQGEDKGESNPFAQDKKTDICTRISEEEKSPLCDTYRQGDAQEKGRAEPATNDRSPEEPGILQQILKEIIANVSEKDVQIQPLLNDFSAYAEDQTDHGRFGHVIEVYGFSRELRTEDLLKPFTEYRDRGFQLQWVDQMHALGIFSSPEDAYSASCRSYPGMKFRPLSQGCHQSKMKAHECAEFHSTKERPQTDSSVAKRMVSRALGHTKQDGNHILEDSK